MDPGGGNDSPRSRNGFRRQVAGRARLDGRRMLVSGAPRSSRIGPAVFLVTLAIVLAFFWWFLIYHHGAPGPS